MKILRSLIIVLLGLSVLVGLAFFAVSRSAARALAEPVEAHRVDFPIPTPLSPGRIDDEGLSADEASRIAMQEAVTRGEHLIRARYGCGDCHGADLGGGVMMDAAPMGRWLGPNLTTGAGSVTVDYGAADWDRIVRHGIRRDGTAAVMPSEDYLRMSDQELSDIVAYIRSLPPVDEAVPERTMGPVARMLMATGRMDLSATRIDHERPHATLPPEPGVNLAFGEHLAAVCVGCHGTDYAGGPIGADPSWPDAANLTPHPDGLAGWTPADFVRALREGVGRDGTELQEPMTYVMGPARQMTDVELEAMFLYLQSLEPRVSGS